MASPVVSPQSSRAPFGDINAGNQKISNSEAISRAFMSIEASPDKENCSPLSKDSTIPLQHLLKPNLDLDSLYKNIHPLKEIHSDYTPYTR